MKNFNIKSYTKYLRNVLVSCALVVTASHSAIAANDAPTYKVGSNALSAVAFGDANLIFENALNDLISVTASAHYVFSTEMLPAEAQGLRGSVGIRAYQREGMKGIFAEFKGGLNYYQGPEENSLTGNALSPSFELFAGYSSMFNDLIYYEAKLGAMRVLKTGKVVPGIGFSTGLKF